MSISNEDITNFSFWVDTRERLYCATGEIGGASYDWRHPIKDCSEDEAKTKCGEAFKWAVEQYHESNKQNTKS